MDFGDDIKDSIGDGNGSGNGDGGYGLGYRRFGIVAQRDLYDDWIYGQIFKRQSIPDSLFGIDNF